MTRYAKRILSERENLKKSIKFFKVGFSSPKFYAIMLYVSPQGEDCPFSGRPPSVC